MSQNNVDYSLNPTGPQLMDNYLAKDQENCLTTNSGIQRPSYAQAGTLWVDTSATPWVLKMYDGSSDVSIGTVNSTTHEFISSNSADVVGLTGAISTVKTSNLTASRAVISNSSGKIAVSATTSTELGYVHGVTSDIQTQLNAKQASNTAVTHTASSAVGSSTKPIYVASNGTATASNSTVGSTTQPVYLNSGTITACTTDTVHVVVETYVNGSSWYRIYDDGWVEQGGEATAGAQVTVIFPKAFSNTNYTVVATSIGTNGQIYAQCIQRTSVSQMTIYNTTGSANLAKSWYACGMGA